MLHLYPPKTIEFLPNQFINCPRYWQNFIISLQPAEHVDVSVSQINKELKKYKAKFIETKTQGCYIRFDDEKLMNWFKLSWT
jgi:hypothetical protein